MKGYPTSLLPQSFELATPAGGEGVGHWFFHQFISDAYDDDQGGFIGLDDYIWGIPQVRYLLGVIVVFNVSY